MASSLRTDFTQAAEFIGSGLGFCDALETPYYIDDLLRMAHSSSAKQFDIDTAAIAVATQSLNHMYEWGTAGVNPAPNTPRIPPTSAAARLWSHTIAGGNTANKRISFRFKPSLVPVPLPTPKSTGIAKGTVGRWPTRRHTFTHKAIISETGVSVTIKPKYSSVLFIPLRGEPMTSNSRAIKNNYIMTSKPVTTKPGKYLAGNFMTHFYAWWNSEGKVLFQGLAEKAVDGDAEAAIDTGGMRRYRGGARMKPFNIQVSAAKAATEALIASRSKARNVSGIDVIEE